MSRTAIKIGAGILAGVILGYLIYGWPEAEKETEGDAEGLTEEGLATHEEPREKVMKRKIIPFPLWRRKP